MKFKVREIMAAEYPLLEEFLYQAIFVPDDALPPSREIIYEPAVFIYIDSFGTLPGDCGVVAEVGVKVAGATWTRIIPAYGHVDMNTPELAVSVLPEYRNLGIGGAMMEHLFDLLRSRNFKQTSLAVQKANPAARFYLRMGYEILRENDEEWIMLKRL